MSPLVITGIAFSLSFDAFAVSLSNGCALEKCSLRHAVTVGLWFGLFQAGMPILGWLGGVYLREAIQAWDHWLAFGLLCTIGLKMIHDGWKTSNGCPAPDESVVMHPGRLCAMAVATSIDALAIGLSFSVLGYPILGPAIVIGLVTFFMSSIGMKTGEKLYVLLEDKVEYAGGFILIVLGIKILLEHLT